MHYQRYELRQVFDYYYYLNAGKVKLNLSENRKETLAILAYIIHFIAMKDEIKRSKNMVKTIILAENRENKIAKNSMLLIELRTLNQTNLQLLSHPVHHSSLETNKQSRLTMSTIHNTIT